MPSRQTKNKRVIKQGKTARKRAKKTRRKLEKLRSSGRMLS